MMATPRMQGRWIVPAGTAASVRVASIAAFRDEMKRQGFVEGENLAIEVQRAQGRFERLPALAVEFGAATGGDRDDGAAAGDAAAPDRSGPMTPTTIVRTLCVAVLAAWTPWAPAAIPEEVVDLPTRGVVQRFLYLKPANPVANVVVLPGGNGVLKLRPDGTGETFVLESSAPSRERQRLAAQGFAVAVVDAPTGWQDGLGLSWYRQSTAHLTDVGAVIDYMRAHANVPVWLLGHSAGSESAFFVARMLPPEQPAGAILSAGAAGTLRNMDPRAFARPVLMISHAHDQCISLADLNRLYDELTAAPARLHVTLTGGDASGGTACSAGYHQFEGLGAEYVGGIAGFVKQHNALVAPPPSTVAAVEYHHAGFDHYFLTWVPAEIAKLDAGIEIQGWLRTGASFNVWRTARAGSSPVCRFYIPPELGDSHFYGRGTAECEATAAANPSFTLEDAAFMHVVLPVGGVCPAGTLPVYRAFSSRADANHRYMTDRALRDAMAASGWLAEGDGPDLVVMCAAP